MREEWVVKSIEGLERRRESEIGLEKSFHREEGYRRKVCIWCGKEIMPDEAWTEDPKGYYWHWKCHVEAAADHVEKLRRDETKMDWDTWVREIIIERGYRKGYPWKKTESKLKLEPLDILYHQLKDLDRISELWHSFVLEKISEEELHNALVEPEHSARTRANWLPEYKDLFEGIANAIKKFREAVMMYKGGIIGFGPLTDAYRELRDYYPRVRQIMAKERRR